jgi:hypothetical protein
LAILDLLREKEAKLDEKIKVVTEHFRNVTEDRNAVDVGWPNLSFCWNL